MAKFKSDSIAVARAWLLARRAEGAACPCCDQFVKQYRRALTKSMSYVLLLMARYYRTHSIKEWLHVPSFIAEVVAKPRRAAAVRGDWAKEEAARCESGEAQDGEPGAIGEPALMTTPGIYTHWKGMKYRVLFTAAMATNKVPKAAGGSQVVYMSLANGEIYVRSEAEFHESVDVNAGDPTAPCLCDARGQDSCRQHPGDPKMQPRFKLNRSSSTAL